MRLRRARREVAHITLAQCLVNQNEPLVTLNLLQGPPLIQQTLRQVQHDLTPVELNRLLRGTAAQAGAHLWYNLLVYQP